jgi:hypothetical protein
MQKFQMALNIQTLNITMLYNSQNQNKFIKARVFMWMVKLHISRMILFDHKLWSCLVNDFLPREISWFVSFWCSLCVSSTSHIIVCTSFWNFDFWWDHSVLENIHCVSIYHQPVKNALGHGHLVCGWSSLSKWLDI